MSPSTIIHISRFNVSIINPQPEEAMIETAENPGCDDIGLPLDPSLHDIHQFFLTAYCKSLGKTVPELELDHWDKGITTSSLHMVVEAVCLEDLKNVGRSQCARTLKNLTNWQYVLRKRLKTLQAIEGCSCFGRHKNSKAVEARLQHIIQKIRSAFVQD
jgi:hypothetical protein